MPSSIRVRSIEPADRAAWEALWAGYNAFYGRKGSTALAPEITDTTWERFFDPEEPRPRPADGRAGVRFIRRGGV